MEVRNVVVYQKETCYPAVLRIPDVTPAPAIVFHIGYNAYMEMYDEVADAFCKAGYVTLQYDGRTQMGRSAGYFRCGTEWLEDAVQGVSYVMGLKEVDPERIGFAGLSMGGGVTLSIGSRDPRIKCLYVMAPALNWREQTKRQWLANRSEEEYQAFINELYEDAARTAHGFPSRFHPIGYAGHGVPLSQEATDALLAARPHACVALPLESFFNAYLFFEPIRDCQFIQIPTCIIHGTEDAALPYQPSKEAFDLIPTENKELHFIEGAGHILPEDALDDVVRIGLNWFDRWL